MSETPEAPEEQLLPRNMPGTLDVVCLVEGGKQRWVQVLGVMSHAGLIRYKDLTDFTHGDIVMDEYDAEPTKGAHVNMFVQKEIDEARQRFGDNYQAMLARINATGYELLSEEQLANVHWGNDRNVREMKLIVRIWGKLTKKEQRS